MNMGRRGNSNEEWLTDYEDEEPEIEKKMTKNGVHIMNACV